MKGLRRIAPTAFLLVALLLAGCSGRSGSGPATNPAAFVPSSVAKSTATLKIVIPAATTAAASARKPAYVSPATQSIAISFTPTVGGPQTFNQNLTPASNPSCTASLISPEVCTVTFALAPGAYTATFATYDGLLDVNSNPTGNVLSQNQSIPVTIVGGQANSINVTLQGVPASVALVPSPTSSLAGTTAGFTLSKCFTGQSVSVVGVDADGNYIIGPGAPVPSLTSSDTTQMAITAPTTASPNVFTLTRPGIPTANATITLTATVTPGSGGGSAASGNIPLTFDATICGTFTEYAIPTSNSDPAEIVVGPDGALWFVEFQGNKIGRISTTGSLIEYAVPTSGSFPYGITSGPDGALWFTEFSAGNIGRITTSGSFTEYTPPFGSAAVGIASGPDGALWFTESSSSIIGRVTTSGSFSSYTVPTSYSAPWRITSGSDGALWFTEKGVNQIGRISTSGSFTEYAVPTSSSYPWGIASGPDGALWFVEFEANNIGRISTSGSVTEYVIPTSGSHPLDIASGPDGALWFTEDYASKIGRITTSGSFTEYVIPTSGSEPDGIASGPDGALWFTENATNKIGRLQ